MLIITDLETIHFLFTGTLEGGQLLHQEVNAPRIANPFRGNTSHEETYTSTVHLSLAESFLYKLINATPRNKDLSKAGTSVRYCYLLWISLQDNEDRGMTLTDGMLEGYKLAVGTCIIQPTFIATSKDRRVAEPFRNTLFIIKYSLVEVSSFFLCRV